MTKVDIFSGFLGAGKTTLIKKLIAEAFKGEKLVLIENEFGEIGIDGGFLKDAGIQITEMNSGCICCSLVGDFAEALKKVVSEYAPDRILIEPSGVGKLSDVTRAVERVAGEADLVLNSFVTVADVNKVKLYMKNFGEFYDDQIEHASTILLSRTGNVDDAKVEQAVALLREKNAKATIVTTDWEELTGAQIQSAMENKQDFVQELLDEAAATLDTEDEHEHHHHHHEDGEEHDHCGCGHHHHDDDDEEHEHDKAHHHDDEEEEHDHDHCGCEHHHHDDDEHDHDHCGCGHHHHHGHDADEIFTSWGRETSRTYTREEVENALQTLEAGKVGTILRAKGIVAGQGEWYHFDYVPGEIEVRTGAADITGRLCVIGSELDEAAIATLFGL